MIVCDLITFLDRWSSINSVLRGLGTFNPALLNSLGVTIHGISYSVLQILDPIVEKGPKGILNQRCACLCDFGLRKFSLNPRSTRSSDYKIYCRLSSGIIGQYVLQTLGLWDFLTQCKLSHIFPLECPVSGLHDLSPRGAILEVDMWPNQEGDTCHIVTDISILHWFKTH
jgi:hypothetical protein